MNSQRLSLPRGCFTDSTEALSREWWVTNGLGGYAAGTVAQAQTRRYHGLLVAALRPPLDRRVLVSKADATASYRGATFSLACNEFADGTLTPRGFELLSEFHLEGTTPVWTFAIGDAVMEQRVWMAQGCNTSYLRYTLLRATASMTLNLVPLCAYRDYHAHGHAGFTPELTVGAADCVVSAYPGARP